MKSEFAPLAHPSRLPLKWVGSKVKRRADGSQIRVRSERKLRPAPLAVAYRYKRVFSGITGAMSWKTLNKIHCDSTKKSK